MTKKDVIKKLKKFKKNLPKYNKTLVAGLGALLTVLNLVFVGNPQVQTAISIATALGVYQVPNKKK